MRIIEGIFYTNLIEDLTQFIAEIRQKEVIDEYMVFIIYSNGVSRFYQKYRKSHDCAILDVFDCHITQCSNKKYLNLINSPTLEDFKKFCDNYDLLEKYIKFTHYSFGWCSLSNNIEFRFSTPPDEIYFNAKFYTTEEFITEIQENYPEFYKYDYSQIKPSITN